MSDADYDVDGTSWDSFVCFVLWGMLPGSYVHALLAGRLADAYWSAHPLLFLSKENRRWPRNSVADTSRLFGVLHIDGIWGDDATVHAWSDKGGLLGCSDLDRARFILQLREGVHNILIKAIRDRYKDGNFDMADLDWLPEMS